MASETTYTCDCCGKPIEGEENERPRPMAALYVSKDKDTWHPMLTINMHTYNMHDGDHYIAPNGANDSNDSWELCYECGKKAKKALREALR